jgi:uncharacterized RDD family membrane protein YckC
MLDSTRRVTTPELIEIHLRPSGLIARGLAFFIDSIIKSIIMIAFFFMVITAESSSFGIGIWLISLFLIEWFYPVIFEIYFNGATPGKKALGLKVIHDNGTPVGWSSSIVRNLLRSADFLPLGYAFGVFSILFHQEFKRLGDIAAGTLVVYNRPPLNKSAIEPVTPIMPLHSLSSQAQQTIISFAEKAPRLTETRQEELAELIPWLSKAPANTEKSGARRLIGIANFIIGRQS